MNSATGHQDVPEDLASRIMALMRHYGHGKRSAFISQVFTKATVTKKRLPMPNDRTAWQIYHRLCDFGLISEFGSYIDLSWQWAGDRLVIIDSKRAVFPLVSAQAKGFRQLANSGLFDESINLDLSKSASESIVFRYLESEKVDTVLREIENGQLSIDVISNSSFIEYLPTADEILNLHSRNVDSLPDSADSEKLSCFDGRWMPGPVTSNDRTYLLRRPKQYLPGYQYWLVSQKKQKRVEMQGSDWLPLILWWIGERRWPIKYMRSNDKVFVPSNFLFMLPKLIRRSILSREMSWPRFSRIAGESFAEFGGASLLDLKALARLYTPAFEVIYE